MSTEPAGDVTHLLAAAGRGDADAMTRVATLVYDELRGLASGVLRSQRPDQTLRTTALVNEAYLRIVGGGAVSWEGRSHFFGVAGKAMRSILVDYARARAAQKRGGAWKQVPMDSVLAAIEDGRTDLLALDAALERLAAIDERKCRVVELRFFAGLTIEQTAEVLGVAHGTVENDWSFARSWLHRELSGEPRGP